MCIRTYEEPVRVSTLKGTWSYSEVHVDFEDKDTWEEIQRLEREGELPENADEDDILKYLGLS